MFLKPSTHSFSPALKAILLTGVVLLLLGGGLIIQQQISAGKLSSGASSLPKTELYSYPGNYRQHISHYYSYYLDSLNRPDIQEAVNLNKAGKFIAWYNPGTPFNLGMQQKYIWLYLPVKNESAHDICLVWQLINSIDTARLFCKTGDEITPHPVISSYTPLHQRALPLRAAFDTVWLKAGEQKELYLHVSKNAYNTYMPFTVLPVAALLEKESFTAIIYCVYVAVFAFIILFNFFLYISLRDVIHLWYPFFIFNISMGLLLEVFFDVFLFPGSLHHIFSLTYNTPFADFSLVGTGRVMQLLLQQKRGNSPFWGAFTGFLITDFVWGCAQLLGAVWCIQTGWHYNYFLFRSVSDVLLWGTTALLVCSVIEKVIQGQPLARIYLFSTMLPTLGILNFFMNGIGMTDFIVLYPNGFAVGVMLEILILTMLLTQRYNLLLKEKNQLLNRQLELQLEMSDRVAETLENEQKRIAADLHDGLGSFLTALRLMVNKNVHYYAGKGQTEPAQTLKTVQSQIDKAVAEIRTISHNLMPYDFEHHRFTEIIKNYLTAISSTTQLNLEYYLDEQIDTVPKNIQITLYRIFTEIMNNALKHSSSDHITVQFINHSSTLQMQVVDEGAGFDKDAIVSGIGLKNIRSRVDFLKGKLIIDTGEKGTTLIVEIPLN